MKHEIIITKEIPDHIKIEMLENLIEKIKEKEEDYTIINFRNNLRFDYVTNKKTIKAKIIGNIDNIICPSCGTHLVDGGFGGIICPNLECNN